MNVMTRYAKVLHGFLGLTLLGLTLVGCPNSESIKNDDDITEDGGNDPGNGHAGTFNNTGGHEVGSGGFGGNSGSTIQGGSGGLENLGNGGKGGAFGESNGGSGGIGNGEGGNSEGGNGGIDSGTGGIPDPVLNPTSIDETIPTTLQDATDFLYTGNDPPQVHVQADAMDADRAAVLRGKVLTQNQEPLVT